MIGHYILDGHLPMLEPDPDTWARWFQTAERHVGMTKVEDMEVSTVFLGLDHQYGDGLPILFETMVFGDSDFCDEVGERYSTWGEAEAGHLRICALVAAELKGRSWWSRLKRFLRSKFGGAR